MLDRAVSQYLIRHGVDGGSQSSDQLFLRIIFSKLFEKIETRLFLEA
ncbi:MAG: hypothetical protein ACRYFU_12435 [Janthinobacterium lividum]